MEEPIWPRAADLLEWVIFPSDRPQSAITEFELQQEGGRETTTWQVQFIRKLRA